MATLIAENPLVEELMNIEGKAEIVDGKIVELELAGFKPGYAAGEIFVSLRQYVQQVGVGRAVGGCAGFLCALPNRQSFSPDAAFYTGPAGEMKFFPEAPIFAVEVRSENDYGTQAERRMSQKRGDYFAAGTLVVWDVDLQGEEVIAKYSRDAPFSPQIFKREEIADAQPALANWKMPVANLFAPQAKS